MADGITKETCSCGASIEGAITTNARSQWRQYHKHEFPRPETHQHTHNYPRPDPPPAVGIVSPFR